MVSLIFNTVLRLNGASLQGFYRIVATPSARTHVWLAFVGHWNTPSNESEPPDPARPVDRKLTRIAKATLLQLEANGELAEVELDEPGRISREASLDDKDRALWESRKAIAKPLLSHEVLCDALESTGGIGPLVREAMERTNCSRATVSCVEKSLDTQMACKHRGLLAKARTITPTLPPSIRQLWARIVRGDPIGDGHCPVVLMQRMAAVHHVVLNRDYLREHGITLRTRLEFNGLMSIAEMVKQGLGIAILPDLSASVRTVSDRSGSSASSPSWRAVGQASLGATTAPSVRYSGVSGRRPDRLDGHAAPHNRAVRRRFTAARCCAPPAAAMQRWPNLGSGTPTTAPGYIAAVRESQNPMSSRSGRMAPRRSSP